MDKINMMEKCKQKRKELFNPILSGSNTNNDILEVITDTFITSIKKIQKKEKGLSDMDVYALLSGVITTWELRDKIMKARGGDK